MDYDSDIAYLQRLVDQARHGLKLCNRVAQQLRTSVAEVHNTVDKMDKVVARLAQPMADGAADAAQAPPPKYQISDDVLDVQTDPQIDGSKEVAAWMAQLGRNALPQKRRRDAAVAQPPPPAEVPVASDDGVMSELDELIARIDYMQAEMRGMQQAQRRPPSRSGDTQKSGRRTVTQRVLGGEAAARMLGSQQAAQAAEAIDVHGDPHSDDFMRPVHR